MPPVLLVRGREGEAQGLHAGLRAWRWGLGVRGQVWQGWQTLCTAIAGMTATVRHRDSMSAYTC